MISKFSDFKISVAKCRWHKDIKITELISAGLRRIEKT